MAENNTAERVLEIARGELGASSGQKYMSAYNRAEGTSIPLDASWCAAFVSWVMRQAGVPLDSVLNYKGCATGTEWFEHAGRFRTRQSGYVPKPGDIVMYEWNPQNDGTASDDGDDHTGLVERVADGNVYTIEGNNGGMCRRDWWGLNNAYISGYGVPLYNLNNINQEEDDGMLTYEQWKDYQQRFDQEQEKLVESGWSKTEGHWKEACDKKVFDGTAPRAPLTREQGAAVLGRLGLLDGEK